MKKICIVGAGPSGLCAIKHSIKSNFEVVAFEKQENVGGTWIYTDETGDEIHSSMYQNLVTNLPKEVMEFPNFPHPDDVTRSFVSSNEILSYLSSYADHHNLREFIKFQHEVIRIRPLSCEMWEVIVKNLKDGKFEIFHFDFVFICNGFSTPKIPKIPGQKLFKGKQMHSHDYRNGKIFENEKVLLIGTGPSGIEMALEAGKYARKVYWSHHCIKSFGKAVKISLPENVTEKCDVESLSENEIVFEDGSVEDVTVIAYATGYDFTFPFLSVDCGLNVEDKHIRPLFKHIFNINNPSMALLSVPFFALSFPLFDLQVRFALKFWRGEKMLPSKSAMLDDVQSDESERTSQGVQKRKFHLLGPLRHRKYYEELAELADVEQIPQVFSGIFDATMKILFENFNIYRNYNFKILDDENFSMTYQD